jgi:hypothetical protein
MSTISHEPSTRVREARSWSSLLSVTEMWASVAIVAIWLAVLFSAVSGPDIVSASNDGTHSTVPSAVAVALFASIATWAVAKYGFGQRRNKD